MLLVRSYHRMIDEIVAFSGQTDKFVHVQIGLAIWLGAALLLRRPLRSWAPLGVVVLVEMGNETMDRLYSGSWRWPDTIGDAAATWAWPAILTFALTMRRDLRR